MKIILSPAKTMKEMDDLSYRDLPIYLDKTKELLSYLLGHSLEEAKALWGCSEKLARENYERLLAMDLTAGLTPALFSYDGIAYTHMAPAVFEEDCLSYVQEHLRILSGFYGVLRPFDGVRPYRLEMGSKLLRPLSGAKNLYEFWGDQLYKAVRDEDGIIVNLASAEYAKAVQAYLSPEDTFLTCVFAERKGEKLTQKAVYAKSARGDMVRFMAERGVKEREELYAFSYDGYHYAQELSDEKTLYFVRG